MKKDYYIDFSGYCVIEAESQEEAEQKFWNNLPTVGKNDVWDIDGVEKKEE